MSFQLLLYPLFFQIFLTLFLLYRLAMMRVRALRSGQVKVSQIALGQNAWPEDITKVTNCYHNQFETPILFYTLIAMVGITQKTNLFFVIFSWAFIVCRYWHAIEEITRNNVPKRFYAFLAGSFTLTLLWIGFFLV